MNQRHQNGNLGRLPLDGHIRINGRGGACRLSQFSDDLMSPGLILFPGSVHDTHSALPPVLDPIHLKNFFRDVGGDCLNELRVLPLASVNIAPAHEGDDKGLADRQPFGDFAGVIDAPRLDWGIGTDSPTLAGRIALNDEVLGHDRLPGVVVMTARNGFLCRRVNGSPGVRLRVSPDKYLQEARTWLIYQSGTKRVFTH